MKTIKILSTRTSTPVVLTSEASTWGELREQLEGDNRFSDLNWATTKVFMKDGETRTVLEFPETALSSAANFKLIISPAQMKAGAITQDTLDAIRERMYKVVDDICNLLASDGVVVAENTSNELTDEDEDDLNEIQSMY